MNLFVLQNLLANAIMFIALLILIFFIFGRSNSTVNKFPLITHWLIKVGLCSMCCGSLFVFLMELENINNIGVAIVYEWGLVRNIGNAMILIWVCLFHWRYFIKNTK